MSDLTDTERARNLTHAILRHYGYTPEQIEAAEQEPETEDGIEAAQTAAIAVDVVLPWLAARERAAAAQIAALRSALERTEANFVAAVNGRPVRDMTETLAENRAALAEQEDQP